MLALLAAWLMAAPPVGHGQGADAPVLLVDIRGAIGFVTAGHLDKAIDKAKAERASALVVRLDTPGGLVSTTREMIRAILASPIPIIVYVAPSGARAASAGTYLAYAAHVAAMAPGTHIGAATPIALGVPGMPGTPAPSKPQSEKDKPADPDPATAAGRKSVNDMVAYLRSLAQLRQRNAEWAEKAVRDAATLTADDALKERVVDIVAGDIDRLLAAADGRTVTTTAGEIKLATKGRRIVEHKADWKTEVMAVIADPNIAFILLLIGFYGIVFEFMHPGAVAPGVIGAISLLVALTALSVLPVNYGGLALLMLGVALMLAEAFSPGFGVVGLGGLVAFVLGALFLFDPGDPGIRLAVSWPLIAGAALLSAAFFSFVGAMALRARRQPVRTGSEEMIGSVGEVVSWGQDKGSIRVHGEIWAARSVRGLTAGQRVRVAGREGLTLLVEEKA